MKTGRLRLTANTMRGSFSSILIDYQNTNDPVLFWFDLNIGKGEIKNADVKIREKSDRETLYIHAGPISSGDTFWKELQKKIDALKTNE